MKDEYKDLPDSVREAAEKADALLAQLDAPKADSSNLVTFSDEELPSPEEAPIVTSLDESIIGDEINTEQDTPAFEEAEVAPENDLEERLTKMTARYKSIQGKYNKEGANDRATIADLRAQLSATPISEPAPVYDETNSLDFLSEKERGEYDGDTLSIMSKIAQHEASKSAQKVAQLQAKLDQKDYDRQENDANNEFNQTLSELAPNWETLNRDEDFLDWLDSTDLPIIGNAREAIQKFDQEGNAIAVAGILNTYKSPVRTPDSAKGLSVPESQLSPKRASSSKVPDGPKAKNHYSPSSIREFYAGYAKGHIVIKGKKLSQDEMDYLYNDIDAAQLEGRISQ